MLTAIDTLRSEFSIPVPTTRAHATMRPVPADAELPSTSTRKKHKTQAGTYVAAVNTKKRQRYDMDHQKAQVHICSCLSMHTSIHILYTYPYVDTQIYTNVYLGGGA